MYRFRVDHPTTSVKRLEALDAWDWITLSMTKWNSTKNDDGDDDENSGINEKKKQYVMYFDSNKYK